jgi:hypothetical protein
VSEQLPSEIAALLAGAVDGVSSEQVDLLFEMLERGPGLQAEEGEIEAFVDQVLATEAGAKIVEKLSQKRQSRSEINPSSQGQAKKEKALRAQLKVHLIGTEPSIWREISLASDANFQELHCAIQDSFGWLGIGGYEFRVCERGQVELLISDRRRQEEGGESGHFFPREMTLMDLLSHGVSEYLYLYDDDDRWEHLITFQGFGAVSSDRGPQVYGGSGLCPPEGCGGVEGFKQFLKGDHPLVQEYGPELVSRIRDGEFDPRSVRFREPSE